MIRQQEQYAHCLVRNIPDDFKIADLRFFFSDFIENRRFRLFHYLHRPEVLQQQTQSKKCCCCLVSFETLIHAIQFKKRYNKCQWINCKGEVLDAVCIINHVKRDTFSDVDKKKISNIKNKKSSKKSKLFGGVSGDDLVPMNSLEEMHPPFGVPNGNVGTPLQIIRENISKCVIPSSFLKKLDIKPSSRHEYRRYGQVPFTYNKTNRKSSSYDSNEASSDQEDEDDDDDDEWEAEEWERHLSLRGDEEKEYLYEEDIQLQWEKGGSGLVFYTDANFWREHDEEEDKEEDDWDVDTSSYYEREPQEVDYRTNSTSFEKLSAKLEEADDNKVPVGFFEKHTNGIAGRIMQKYGWKRGKGLGVKEDGIPHPLSLHTQSNKRGIGYQGKIKEFKALRRKKQKTKEHTIATVYDEENQRSRENKETKDYNYLNSFQLPPTNNFVKFQNCTIEQRF